MVVPAWHFCLSHLRRCHCAGCRVVSREPPFSDVSLHYSRNISRWWSSDRDVSLPPPAACLGSFSPRPVLPSEPEPEAPLLCLLRKVAKSSLPVVSCDSKSFQEPLCGCSGEAPTPDLHWEGECFACEHIAASSAYLSFFRSYVASICSSHGIVSSTMMTTLAGADQSTMSGRRDVMVISAGNFSWRSRLAANCHSLDFKLILCFLLSHVPSFLSESFS